jgi:hypothetical protein
MREDVNDAAGGVRPVTRRRCRSAQNEDAIDIVDGNIVQAGWRLPASLQSHRVQLPFDADAIDEQQWLLCHEDPAGPTHPNARTGAGDATRLQYADPRQSGRERLR